MILVHFGMENTIMGEREFFEAVLAEFRLIWLKVAEFHISITAYRTELIDHSF